MEHSKGRFDLETLTLLRVTLDAGWAALTPEQQARNLKSEMALRLLRLAQQGERDPAKLHIGAMFGIRSAPPSKKRPPTPSVSREVPEMDKKSG